MTPAFRFATDNQPVRLGRQLGGGGEGQVFELAGRPSRAVKIYWPGIRENGAKVAAMVAQGLAGRTRLVSFPEQVVIDGPVPRSAL